MLAVTAGNAEGAQYILSLYKDAVAEGDMEAASNFASDLHNEHVITLAVERGPNILPGHVGNYVGTVRILLENGASKDVCDSSGRTLREIALSNGHDEMVALLDENIVLVGPHQARMSGMLYTNWK